jgi:hypothetical protein
MPVKYVQTGLIALLIYVGSIWLKSAPK